MFSPKLLEQLLMHILWLHEMVFELKDFFNFEEPRGPLPEWPQRQAANISPVPVNSTNPFLFSFVINLVSTSSGTMSEPRISLILSEKNPTIEPSRDRFVDVITICLGPIWWSLFMHSHAELSSFIITPESKYYYDYQNFHAPRTSFKIHVMGIGNYGRAMVEIGKTSGKKQSLPEICSASNWFGVIICAVLIEISRWHEISSLGTYKPRG